MTKMGQKKVIVDIIGEVMEEAIAKKIDSEIMNPPKPKKKKQTLSSVKKRVWNTYSIYIRLRDCLKTTGCSSFGLCITCGKRYHFKLLQAGHFIPGRKNSNLFEETGCHAQCYNCNINLKGNTLEYRRKIIQMYGEGYDEWLEENDRQVKQYKISDLLELEAELKEKIRVLSE